MLRFRKCQTSVFAATIHRNQCTCSVAGNHGTRSHPVHVSICIAFRVASCLPGPCASDLPFARTLGIDFAIRRTPAHTFPVVSRKSLLRSLHSLGPDTAISLSASHLGFSALPQPHVRIGLGSLCSQFHSGTPKWKQVRCEPRIYPRRPHLVCKA